MGQERWERQLSRALGSEGVWPDCLIFLLFRSYFSTTQKEEEEKKLSRAQVWNEYRAFLCACVSVCVREQESPANKYIVSACINCFHNHLKYKSFACPETDLMSRREKEEEKKEEKKLAGARIMLILFEPNAREEEECWCQSHIRYLFGVIGCSCRGCTVSQWRTFYFLLSDWKKLFEWHDCGKNWIKVFFRFIFVSVLSFSFPFLASQDITWWGPSLNLLKPVESFLF